MQQQANVAAADALGQIEALSIAEPCYLPFEVLVAVLQLVPQQQRLALARVCRSWATAAAAASSSIQLSLAGTTPAARHERTAGFSTWLQQHAAQLSSLELQGHTMSRPRLQLPADALQQLQNLCLTDCRAVFASSTRNQPPTSAPAAAALTSIQLQGCVLEWSLPSLPKTTQAVALLSNLCTLCLQQLLPGELSREQQAALQQIVPAAFRQMTQLTRLVLKQLNQYESVLLAGVAAGLGGMRHLIELQVDMMQLTAPALAELPSSITLLELAGAKQLVLSSSALPCLTHLKGLQELLVEGVRRFEPALLRSMPQLRSLRIRSSSSSRFLPDGTLGTQDLLAALRDLTHLQILGLRNVLQHLLDEQQAQAYSGLTASSALQQLDLSACRFPPNSGPAVLHGGCSLPHLQRLVLYRCEDPPGSVLQVTDLDRLVECCPVLEDLALWLSLSNSGGGSSGGGSSGGGGGSGSGSSSFQAGQPQLQPLVGSSALTRLVVAGPGVTCGELGAVAQLQRLQSLAMYRCSALTDVSLLQLTQLTRLTTLAIDAHSCVTKWLGVTEYLFLQGPAGRRAPSAAAAGAQPGASTQLSSSPTDQSTGIARAIMAVRRELPIWQQLRRLLLTGSLLGDA